MEDGITYNEINLSQFAGKFSDEKKCIDYLFKMRWPKGFECPRCGHKSYYVHINRKLYQCKCCAYQTSVTAGTIFHKTRTPLVKWFWAIFLITRQKVGISAVALKKMLEIKSYQTIWLMCHKIRKAMSDRDAKYQLAGIVEMDETYVGSSKSGKRGRGSQGKTIVEICVENNGDKPGYASMKVIKNVTSREIAKVADEKLKKGSTIKSDGFKSYNILETKGYKLDAQKASGKDASNVLKWVHTLIGNVKSTIEGVFHGIGGKHLQSFLDEYCYRFNRRYKEKELFDRLIAACTRTFTITYSELTG